MQATTETPGTTGRGKRIALLLAVLLALVVVGLVLLVSRPGNAAPSADCRTVPAATVAPDDATRRSATLVYDATYVHMDVPGLDAWAGEVSRSDTGRDASRFVSACDALLGNGPAISTTVPADARRALAAVRRYSLEQWNERPMTRLLPVVVRRSTVADKRGWSFVLVGPEPSTWRYAVVDDRDAVLAWQLTGQDARRLFDRADAAGPA